jgi:lysophospholipase L1-like esterase
VLFAVAVGCSSTAATSTWPVGDDGGMVDSPSASFDAGGPGDSGTDMDRASATDAGPHDGATNGSEAGASNESGTDASDGGTYPSDASGDAGSVAKLRWVGRVDSSDPSAVRFAWSAAGFAATVNGTKVSVSLSTESATGSGDVYFQPVVDGKPRTRFRVSAGPATTVVLASGLAAGSHTVELYRETEAEIEDVLYVTVFHGFVDGQVVGAPAPSGRLIEIIGDSISCGYGNLCNGPNPFSVDTESAYQAYGPQLAQLLGADVSIVAHSGWGVYRDGSGDTTKVMAAVYGNTVGTDPSPQWDFSVQPDAIVINLGTNDSAQGDPGTPYETAYVAFLQTVRARNPHAWIFLTIGPMTDDPELTMLRGHLANVVSAFGDSRVATIDIAVQGSSVGCDYHPTVAEDTTMASALAPTIRAKLGW